ncbi:hypothetical protein [Rubritalea profundi]|uniref:hypothetical protein n=1 Tax=Rubritalea profundi TaxID=1658618 RepID=UPI0013FDCAE4|nr:hypothetical protein [Rubritalea profundi]
MSKDSFRGLNPTNSAQCLPVALTGLDWGGSDGPALDELGLGGLALILRRRR